MKVFTRDYRMEHYRSPVFDEYFGDMKPCVLDIEATGLNPATSKLVMMALLTETDTGVRITQFLAENHYEEDRVLRATLEFLESEHIDYLITFNGIRYDIPFINTRLERLFMDERIRMYDFDLYRFLRKCTILPTKQASLSQSACEQYFGIASDRKDIITGKENVTLFEKYALSGDATIEKIILTHNREDVLQLYKLMLIAGSDGFRALLSDNETSINNAGKVNSAGEACEAGKASGADEGNGADKGSSAAPVHPFHAAIARFGYPVAGGRLSVRPKLCSSGKQLKICGDQIKNPFAAAYFPDIDSPITASFNATSSSYEISLPVQTHAASSFVDLKLLGIELEDENVVNGFLILDDRTINLLSAELAKKYLD